MPHPSLSNCRGLLLAALTTVALLSLGGLGDLHAQAMKDSTTIPVGDSPTLGPDDAPVTIVEQFKDDMDKTKAKSQYEKDMKMGKEVGVRGTPCFFINGHKIVGAQAGLEIPRSHRQSARILRLTPSLTTTGSKP